MGTPGSLRKIGRRPVLMISASIVLLRASERTGDATAAAANKLRRAAPRPRTTEVTDAAACSKTRGIFNLGVENGERVRESAPLAASPVRTLPLPWSSITLLLGRLPDIDTKLSPPCCLPPFPTCPPLFAGLEAAVHRHPSHIPVVLGCPVRLASAVHTALV